MGIHGAPWDSGIDDREDLVEISMETMKKHEKTIGKWWFFMGFDGIYHIIFWLVVEFNYPSEKD